MSRRHESTLCSALEHFIQQTIPEYITDTGKMIVAENGISNLLWHMEDTYSQASCTVHGEDFQAYSPTITIRLSDNINATAWSLSEVPAATWRRSPSARCPP